MALFCGHFPRHINSAGSLLTICGAHLDYDNFLIYFLFLPWDPSLPSLPLLVRAGFTARRIHGDSSRSRGCSCRSTLYPLRPHCEFHSGNLVCSYSSVYKEFVQKDQQSSCRIIVVGAHMAH